MNLRKLVRETLYRIIKEEENIGDISAAQQLISSMEENGFKKVDSEMNYEEGTLVLVLKSNDETLPYDVSLSMSFVINDLSSYSPGRFGGTADTDIAPYAEPGDWSIKLDNAFVYSKFDEVFRGKDVFQEFFDNNIEEIKGYFDEEIQEKMSDDLEDEGPDPDDAYERYRDSMMDLSEVFGELETAYGNPLNGKSKQSAINYIYKIFKQADHGQRYRDEAWENVHKIFNLFNDYGMDTVGGYDAEYNPGGISVDETTSQWKKWKIDFNFTDNKGRERTLVFLLTAHAAGTVQDPWDSYDITFYPIGEKGI